MTIKLTVNSNGKTFVPKKDKQKDERIITSRIRSENDTIIQSAITNRNNTTFNIITDLNSGLVGGKSLTHGDSVTIGVNLDTQYLIVSGSKIGIKPKSINGDLFKPGSIDGTHISDGSIVSSKVSINAINSSHIETDSINSRVIVPGTVTIDKFNGSLPARVIVDKAITKSKIKNSSIEGDNLNDELVDGLTFEFYRDVNDSKKKIKLMNSSIEEKHIQLEGLGETILANNSIDSTKIENGAITANKIKRELFDDTIQYNDTTSQTILNVMNNSIQTKHLKYESVDSSKLKESSVLTIKLKDGEVDGYKMDASVVDNKTLEFLSDSSNKKIRIKDGGIDHTIMEDDTINGANFKSETINGDKLNKNSTYFQTSSDGTLKLNVEKDSLNKDIIDDDSIVLQTDNKLGLNIKNVHIKNGSLNASLFNMSSDITGVSNTFLDLTNISGSYFADESFTKTNLDTELEKIYTYYEQGGRL